MTSIPLIWRDLPLLQSNRTHIVHAKMGRHGEVAEWSIAAVSKTVEPLRVPGVRISPSPPFFFIPCAAPSTPAPILELTWLVGVRHFPTDSDHMLRGTSPEVRVLATTAAC